MSEENNTLKRKHEDELLDDQNEKNLELDESYVTMIDVLKEEEKLEEDANAVLGGSDDKNCTYEQGYINRQALYSCRTCIGDNKTNELNDDIFGICLACSYACHTDHDLVELYTKRAFRCDCGNSKMKGNCCTLFAAKDSLNEQNKYNHNFIGNYCLCDQPYPNPDGKDEEMVQCIVCEDWFHEKCLECNFPDDNDYAEMICKGCMSKNDFLWFYYQTDRVKIKPVDTQETVIVDAIDNDIKNKEELKTGIVESESNNQNDHDNERKISITNNGEATIVESSTTAEIKNGHPCLETDTTSSNTNGKEESIKTDANEKSIVVETETKKNQCKLKSLKSKFNIENRQGTTFWDEDWRTQLCRCEECLILYSKNNVEFLTDETDTVHYYEAKGKEKCQKLSQYEQGLNEITRMGHVAGIEAIMEYQKMSSEFKEHFKKFAEDKKVISQKDIEEFFATLKYKKRMKLSHSF